MSNEADQGTIDWGAYWADVDEEMRAESSPSSHHAADVLSEFVERFDTLDGVADVGCGTGVTTFAASAVRCYCTSNPPSMIIGCPITYEASSEQSQTTVLRVS